MAESVLLIDDDISLCRLLAHWLKPDGYGVEIATTAAGADAALERMVPDVIVLDLGLPDRDGMALLEAVHQRHPTVPIVVLTATDEIETVVAAMHKGAWDYMTKPPQGRRFLTTVRNAVQHRKANMRVAELEQQLPSNRQTGLIGESPGIHELHRQIARVGPSEVTVLVRGESGTGKELVARALHTGSRREKGPFIAVNCAAIPESLQESELFGHEKGAFTGAIGKREGWFERASGGTLFLDEVGELTPSLQAALLRVLQERRLTRVGGSQEISVDVRLVSATHRDLSAAVREGKFREDLYYRLAVFELGLPPLRERGEDIILIARHLVEVMAPAAVGHRVVLDEAAEASLRQHRWPGNVRELRNAIERALVLCNGDRITVADLPQSLGEARGSTTLASRPAPTPARPQAPEGAPLGSRLDELERAAIVEALAAAGGKVDVVAKALGVPRSTLYRKLKLYGLRP